MDEEKEYREAEDRYYGLNRQIRCYSSHIQPTKDPQWRQLLHEQREARMIFNIIRQARGLQRIWP